MILGLLLACSPAEVSPPVGASPAAAPVVAPPPAPPPGSLWSEVGSRALIGMDGNARRVGDLITVLVDESATTTLGADTSSSREGSAELGIGSLLGLETSIPAANPNMGGKIEVSGSSSTSHEGTGRTSRQGTLTATITCQVEEVLPNGNLRIRGTKEVRVNHETQYLTLEGIVRPRDIHLDNTVHSDVIADARVEYTGVGVVGDKQRQGWGTAVMDVAWPF